MEEALKIVQLLNAVTPGIAQLIIMIRNNDGTISVVTLLDEADAKFKDNIQKAKDWLEKNK